MVEHDQKAISYLDRFWLQFETLEDIMAFIRVVFDKRFDDSSHRVEFGNAFFSLVLNVNLQGYVRKRLVFRLEQEEIEMKLLVHACFESIYKI